MGEALGQGDRMTGGMKPPGLLEGMVGLLIPPASRENVLGDLQERYRSPGQYVVDALSTVPMVAFSRIRRTTDPQILLMEAFALYLAFVTAAWSGDQALLTGEWGLLRLSLPPAVALLVQ